MKYFAIAALLGAASATSEVEAAFLGYITQFGKTYSTMAEFEHRLANFSANHEHIAAHNAMPSNFKLGHNQFSDWTDAEYKAMLTYRPEHHDTTDMLEMPRTGVAQPVDWRDEGAVNEVQNQAACGSCWTFSTMASFEGAHFIATGNLEKYAEQQLVDCVHGLICCHGCNGGNVSYAFKYLSKHDAMYETEYAYTAKDGTCAQKDGSGVRVV